MAAGDVRGTGGGRGDFRIADCLRRCVNLRVRNETIFFMSLIQALCSLAAIILSSIVASKRLDIGIPCLVASSLIMSVAVQGVATSRCKTFGTVLALFVMCQFACAASLVLMCCSGYGLHSYINRTAASTTQPSGSLNPSNEFSDLVTNSLTLIISMLEFGSAASCGLSCCRQLRPRDPRIVLDKRGNGLVVLADDPTGRLRSRLRPPPLPPPLSFRPSMLRQPTPPPAYSTMDRRRRRWYMPQPQLQPPPPDYLGNASSQQQQQQQLPVAVVVDSTATAGGDTCHPASDLA